MKTNFHTHTMRCNHAMGTERDYVSSAIKQGVDILGFSDHAPFPDKDYGLRMQYDELDEYIECINKLSKEFGGIIKLHKGLEIEYQRIYLDYYKELFEKHKLEYLALGEHIYLNESGKLRNIFFAETTNDYVSYALAVSEALETGFFAFVAHPDLMFINELAWDKNCDKACEIILLAAEKYNVPLEFNANGLRRGESLYPDGKRYPYPHFRFWERLRGSRQKVIIGSDSHIPEQIYDESMLRSEQLCADLNLNVIKSIFEEDL